MYLGINQPIPLAPLTDIIFMCINEEQPSAATIHEMVREVIKGDNRAKKALSHINQVLSYNHDIFVLIRKYLGRNKIEALSPSDKKALILLCLANRYPIVYLVCNNYESLFRTQETINKSSIQHKITAIHGSNRGIFNAIDATICMLIDLGIINRIKPALYKKGLSLNITSSFIYELCIWIDIKNSGSKSILADDIAHRAWYSNFIYTSSKPKTYKLLKIIESSTGAGYLTIK